MPTTTTVDLEQIVHDTLVAFGIKGVSMVHGHCLVLSFDPAENRRARFIERAMRRLAEDLDEPPNEPPI